MAEHFSTDLGQNGILRVQEERICQHKCYTTG